jgi:NADH-quinone oxidoreductase subunit J
MSAQLAVFFILAAMAVAGAVSLIVQRHPIHSALSLIVVMAALAGLYLLLEAEFIAAIQIIVYAGAIMVLFVFVIMLLNAGVEERTSLSRTAFYAGMPLAMFLLVELAYRVERASAPMAAQPSPAAATRGLAMLLFQDFAFPFEATSILILIAILGAIVLAKRDV